MIAKIRNSVHYFIIYYMFVFVYYYLYIPALYIVFLICLFWSPHYHVTVSEHDIMESKSHKCDRSLHLFYM